MKRLLLSLVVLSATAISGQAVQSGTPAEIEVANGKKVKGFLQSLENDILTFHPNRSSKEYPAPVDKIKGLTFFPKYDAFAVEQSFNTGEYSDVIITLGPMMKPYWEYMAISNNLQSVFGMLVKSHLANEDFDQVQRAAEVLMESKLPNLLAQGQIYSALVALSATTTNGLVTTNGLAMAEKMRDEVESEAAGLYLQACIERAKGEPRKAIWTICGIISDHGNDMDWMPASEWLAANLYLDDGMTNSAANCARQVQSIYAGSNIAIDAEKLRKTLPEKAAPPVEEEPPAEQETEEPEAVEPEQDAEQDMEQDTEQDGMQEE